MAMTFDAGAVAMSPYILQRSVEDALVEAQAYLDQQHDAAGGHTAVTLDSLESRTGDPLVLLSGAQWQGGPWIFGSDSPNLPTSVIRVPSITANQNNYAPLGIHEALVVELEASAAYTITGIAAHPGRERRFLRLVNRSNYTLTLASNSGSSSSANRLYFGGSAYLFKTGTILDLYYDPGAPIWRGPEPAPIVSIPSVIDSIQYGSITVADGASSNTATITSVDTSKSVLSHMGETYDPAEAAGGPVHLALTNATTVTASRGSFTNGALVVRFCVVEYT